MVDASTDGYGALRELEHLRPWPDRELPHRWARRPNPYDVPTVCDTHAAVFGRGVQMMWSAPAGDALSRMRPLAIGHYRDSFETSGDDC